MLDPGALGTLIIRNDAQRADAERMVAGASEEPVARERRGLRVGVANGLRRLATVLAGPEPSADTPGASAARSLGLTWTDR